ncbi:MAG: C25 family cysteine peptidase [Deltaproteobacteria bacterium]|nr:C25 family cysteine peptidase [Deltaproteobacteria bacterium]
MRKVIYFICAILILGLLQNCSDNEEAKITDVLLDTITDTHPDATSEDTSVITNKLRGYFCETNRDCDESEVCLEMMGITERVCQPSAFVTFIDSTTFTIDTAELEVDFIKDEKGRLKPVIKGFSNISSPGDPDLPSITLNVLVPPDTDTNKIKLIIITEESYDEDGTFDIAPAGPANFKPDTEGVATYEDWIKDKEYIVNGYNTKIYSRDALFTEEPIKVMPAKQMRKWIFVPVQFYPLRYNPIKKTLKRTGFIKAHIEAPRIQGAKSFNLNQLLVDNIFDSDAEKMFVNFKQLSSLYKISNLELLPPPTDKNDYVIITTSTIKNNLKQLQTFVNHKQSIGYKVFVADESVWGNTEGKDGPEKVRNWLKNNYISMGIQYVLLIADPNDTSGPAMRTCWPRAKEKKDDWERTPTDMYYSDLTGNWNKNGDDLWCEYYGDYTRGGIDLTPEVYVGRIPVYPGKYSEVDSILQRIVKYEQSKDIDWRYTAMLPNPISDYSQEEDHSDSGNGSEIKRNGFTVDGAKFAERMKAEFLNSQNKFKTTSLYEKRGPEPSVYNPDLEFSKQNVINEWRKGYGLISWWAHGNSTSAAGKVWKSDSNNDKIAQLSEKEWEDFAYSQFPDNSYNPEKPSFTSQVSCLNSRPDKSNNLSYTLLAKGGAISAMGATSVTLYSPAWSYPNSNRMDNVSFGFYYTKNISKNYPAGKALALVRAMSSSLTWQDGSLMNILSFNLFGDPSLSLFTTYTPSQTTTDPILKDNGHSFDKNAVYLTDNVLKWSLFYTLNAPKGKIRITAEILRDGSILKNQNGKDIVASVERNTEPSIILKFDGDKPDIIILKQDELKFLGSGIFNLGYRLRYTFINDKGQSKELLLTQIQPFSIEVKASTSIPTLQSGIPYKDSFDTKTKEKYYKFIANAEGRLKLELTGPNNADFDLYIKEGTTVSTSIYDNRSYGATANELIELDVKSTEYSILVNRYSGSGDFTITPTFMPKNQDYMELKLGTIMSGTLPAAYNTFVYKVIIPKDGKFTALLEGPAGSIVDLYIKKDKVPTTSSYYSKSIGSTNAPELTVTVTKGTYYLMLRTRKGSGNYTILGELD